MEMNQPKSYTQTTKTLIQHWFFTLTHELDGMMGIENFESGVISIICHHEDKEENLLHHLSLSWKAPFGELVLII